jgi:DNA-binding NtrC family response regulator
MFTFILLDTKYFYLLIIQMGKDRTGKILIIDDNTEFLVALKILLSPHFENVTTEAIPDRIKAHLNSEKFDVILLDMNFKAGIQSGNEGFYWMNKIREIDEEVSVIFITAYGDVDLAIRSLKEGVTDFIQKSWDENKILSTVLSAYNLNRSNKEINRLKNQQQHLKSSLQKQTYELVIGHSPRMNEILGLINRVAKTEANILITGESGTGKEVIAHEIHKKSLRKNELMVSVDLGTIHENLFESELFGHSKGAFTDALSHRAGRIELANGGTLFLDEIGNLTPSLQMKLLTVIQNKTVTRLGENQPRQVDFRLISATNRSLDKMISENVFREDLLYRLKTVEIHLPPLRERKEDIPELTKYYLDNYSKKYNKNINTILDTSLNKLIGYNWPGNVRELQHLIEKAVILSDGSQLKISDDMLTQTVKVNLEKAKSFNLEENEKEVIENALKAFNGNMSKTAKELGINRSTLYEKIKKYEL